MTNTKVFQRLQARIGQTADRYAADILFFEPDLTDPQLAQTLEVALGLEPLQLEEPDAVRIGLLAKSQPDGSERFLHQMTARYRGSGALWKARPMPRALLMLRGKASESVLTVENWMKDWHFERFEQNTRRLLDNVREALPLQEPEVEAFNAKLPAFCAEYVPARAEEAVGWRRRGHQHRERERQLDEFKQSQAPIDPLAPAWKHLAVKLAGEGRRA